MNGRDGAEGSWQALTNAFGSVWDLIWSNEILMWVFVIALVASIGSMLGKLLGAGVRTTLSIVGTVVGIGLIWWVLRGLGIL